MRTETFVDVEVFPWNSNFELGITSIDTQHRKLVAIINKLAYHLVNHAEEIVLDSVLEELIDYANFHFNDEERIWQKVLIEDSALQKHHASHVQFSHEVLNLKSNLQHRAQEEVLKELVNYLTTWLARHILDEDKRMALVLEGVQQGMNLTEAKQHSNEQMGGAAILLINTVLSMYDTLSSRTIDLMREKSKRLKVEEELRKSEEKWKLLLDAGTEEIWHWDIPKQVLHTINKGAQVEQILDNYRELDSESGYIHPDDIEKAELDLQDHLDGKTELFINSHRVMKSDGSCRWVMTRGKVVERTEDGKALRMIGTHSDITERELAIYIYNNSKQAMIVCNADNQILSANPAFTAITGYPISEVIGKNPSLLNSGLQDKKFYEELWESVYTRRYWKGRLYDRRKNGEIYPAYLEIIMIVDANGKPDKYIAFSEDITELEENRKTLKRQEDKLVQQSRMAMMGEMISMIAHQWRQPLGAISSCVLDMEMKLEIEAFDLQTPEGLNECTEYYKTSLLDISGFVKVLTTTIDDFRNFYKPQREMLETRIEVPVLKALKILGYLTSQNAIELEESYEANSTVTLSMSEIMQVVINILRNAQENFQIKQTPKPRIRIRSYETQQSVILELCDNGGGIPDALLEKIFDPYFTTKSADEGTGLGLHMSKTIIEVHHEGSISAKNIDDGVCFVIALPKKRA
ncbi:MAG: bacteriohemerythrin [Campylobacterales bacterium]|nr:bacteriohemerythrin [Campylobacterales bacterium]